MNSTFEFRSADNHRKNHYFNKTIKMKVAFLFLAVVIAVSYAQFNIVAHEVHAIIAADSTITVADCTEKCDNVFMLIDTHDEDVNDRECAHQCTCQINHTCGRPPLRTTTAAP